MAEAWRAWAEGIYEVSSLGRVRRINPTRTTGRNHVLSPHEDKLTGYLLLGLRSRRGKRRTRLLHRVVARVWLGPPRGREVNHKNGMRSDCRVSNLEYLSKSANIRDSIARTRAKGLRGPADVLTVAQVRKVRARLAKGHTQVSIARQYGLHKTTIGCIARGKTWRFVS